MVIKTKNQRHLCTENEIQGWVSHLFLISSKRRFICLAALVFTGISSLLGFPAAFAFAFGFVCIPWDPVFRCLFLFYGTLHWMRPCWTRMLQLLMKVVLVELWQSVLLCSGQDCVWTGWIVGSDSPQTYRKCACKVRESARTLKSRHLESASKDGSHSLWRWLSKMPLTLLSHLLRATFNKLLAKLSCLNNRGWCG